MKKLHGIKKRQFHYEAIQKELDELDPDLPELPEGKTILENDNWLYDSIRDYFEQLEYYKAG